MPTQLPAPSPRPRRSSHLAPLFVVGALTVAAPGCDGGKQEKAAPEKAEEKAEAEPEAAPPAPKGLAPDAVELPWMFEDVQAGLAPGQRYVYALSGKDAKGKEVEDSYACDIKAKSASNVGVACNRVEAPVKGAGELATLDWSRFSPMFALEKPKHTLVERSKVTVPAGEFDTVVVELEDFFGNGKRVWMAVDHPGVYAKVVELPNAGTEDDQTELTYELAEIVKP